MLIHLRHLAMLFMLSSTLAGCHTTSLGKAVGFTSPPARSAGQ
ncbi:hypothetical protein [Bosea sp. UC22_33]